MTAEEAPSTSNQDALIAPASLREQVEDALASRIVSGQYEPGTVLTAPTLATQFGVSATPVREALLTLQRRGFLEPIRNKGFRVTGVELEELAKLAEVRALLECPPMRQVAGRIDAALRAELDALADEIVDSAAEGRLQEYLSADTRFHLLLIEQVGNPHLTRIVRDLRQRTRLGGLAELAESRELSDSAAEHRQLVELLVAGDGAAAEQLMRVHIGHVPGIWSGRSELEHG